MSQKNDRFTDLAFMQGDFKKVNTSPSQTALNNWMWFIKYPLALHLNFKPESPSISFKSGTAIHQYFQNILMGKMKIGDVEKQYKFIAFSGLGRCGPALGGGDAGRRSSCAKDLGDVSPRPLGPGPILRARGPPLWPCAGHVRS